MDTVLHKAALSRAQPHRGLFLHVEAIPPCRDLLRQARSQLPRDDPTRLKCDCGSAFCRRAGWRLAFLIDENRAVLAEAGQGGEFGRNVPRHVWRVASLLPGKASDSGRTGSDNRLL